MGNFATVRVAALTLTLFAPVAAAAATQLPPKLGYTFYLRGERAGHANVRIAEKNGTITIESTFDVGTGASKIALTTHTEADAHTYALRSFSYKGTKGGTPVAASVTVLGDSVYGSTTAGSTVVRQGRRVTPKPVLVWEDWTMDLEILLGLQQSREFQNPLKRGVVLAASYSSALATIGFTGEVSVESATQSLIARKLVVAIEGGQPFESLIDPKRWVPVYLRFPGVGAEIFLDDFYGDNPVSKYPAPNGASSGR